jgi:arylsulfatase A-like enzyme
MRESSASPYRWAALVSAALVAPVVVRFTQMLDHDLTMRLADCRGFFADLGVSLLLASGLAALTKLPRFARTAGAIVVGFWSLLNFANYEHVRELGSIVNLSYAGYMTDATFFRGSALAPTHPILLVVTTLVSISLVISALDPKQRYRLLPLLSLALVVIVIAGITPRATAIASWRQADLVTAQFRRSIEPAGISASDRLLARDLDGPQIIEASPRAVNVLLVIVEGVSGAFLPSLRSVHGATATVIMPELDRVARSGLSYATFISTQRQTNRGEFALLCGDYPKLVTAEAKMTELAGGERLECLPATLSNAGYSTAYLQAAPLPFMMKDQFMPRAGFDRVLGDAWFTHAYNRNHWGVDDRAFFESSLELIDELDRNNDPWFLTLLTVGTHHRYNVPPDFEGQHDPGSAQWAFEYLDLAIGDFISQLESRGILDDTLVLITSDESQAMEAGAPDWMNSLTQGWGFLIALLPSGETGVIEEIFTQPDIPISVLDYFEVGSPRRDYSGRSVFRHWDTERALFWGNTHLRMISGLSSDLRLTICTENFAVCGTAPLTDQKLFSPDKELRDATVEEIEWLQNAVRLSLTDRPGDLEQRSFILVGSEPQPITRTNGQQYVFGGQFLTIPDHSRAEVEIVVELRGAPGSVDLVHNFIVDRQPYESWDKTVRTGETLRLHYTIGTDSLLDEAECRLWVTDSEGTDLELVFHTAKLEIVPMPSSEPVPQTILHTFQIE